MSMRNGATFYKDMAKAGAGRRACWCVSVPAVISPTGKRLRQYVTSERSARELASKYNAGMPSSEGGLPPDFETARLMLEPHDVGIVEAAAFCVEMCKRYGNLGNARQIAIRGAGAAAPGSPALARALDEMNTAKCHLAPATLETRMRVFSRIWRDSPDLASMPCSLVTGEVIQEALVRSWPHAATCYNNAIRQLRALFSWAIRKKYTATNPALELDFLPHKETEITALTPAQVAAILRACRPPTTEELERRATLYSAIQRGTAPTGASYDVRWLPMDTTPLLPAFTLMAFAGIRPREVERLVWGDISLEDGVVSVRGNKSKTGGTRHVTIRPVLRAWLKTFGHHEHDEPVLPSTSLKFKLTAVHRRAGFDGPGGQAWQPDALRHTFASMALKSGTELASLEQDMGHADASMLRARYLNMRGLTAAAAKEFWSLTPRKLRK